jgi:DNA modification methylase
MDVCVTDPPYELGFMGKDWDSRGVSFQKETWAEVLRVLKPGAHLLAFGGTRTYHRIACAIEDAGFEVRDCIMWLQGQGFPKSLDIGKAIDRAAGVEREVVGTYTARGFSEVSPTEDGRNQWAAGKVVNKIGVRSKLTSPEAKQWEGWGTALKPSYEPVICARKPFTVVPSQDILQAELAIGSLICLSLSSAKHAESLLRLNQNGYDAEYVSAQLIAGAYHGLLNGDLCVQMATFKSPEIAKIILNIVDSWNTILGAICESRSTFITSTAIGLTTALKTFNCLVLEIIRDTITLDGANQLGRLLRVPIAGAFSSGINAAQVNVISAHELVTLLTKLNVASNVEMNFMLVARAASSVLRNATTNLEKNFSPAYEPVILARKPLVGTVAQNVLTYGTGGLNIDGCRIPTAEHLGGGAYSGGKRNPTPGDTRSAKSAGRYGAEGRLSPVDFVQPSGRWPANVVLDEEAAQALDAQSREKMHVAGHARDGSTAIVSDTYNASSINCGKHQMMHRFGDDGGASRFFYTAKVSPAERNAAGENRHPTVKPLALMRYLVKLVTPPGGLVLDPFMGSGSTGVAAILEGDRFVGIDLLPDHVSLAQQRILHYFRRPVSAAAVQEIEVARCY